MCTKQVYRRGAFKSGRVNRFYFIGVSVWRLPSVSRQLNWKIGTRKVLLTVICSLSALNVVLKF